MKRLMNLSLSLLSEWRKLKIQVPRLTEHEVFGDGASGFYTWPCSTLGGDGVNDELRCELDRELHFLFLISFDLTKTAP